MSDSGGNGSARSTSRKIGVSTLSATICRSPNVRRLRSLPLSHHAAVPTRLKRSTSFTSNPLSTASTRSVASV